MWPRSRPDGIKACAAAACASRSRAREAGGGDQEAHKRQSHPCNRYYRIILEAGERRDGRRDRGGVRRIDPVEVVSLTLVSTEAQTLSGYADLAI